MEKAYNNIISLYNELDNEKVSRDQVQQIFEAAIDLSIFPIISKLKKLLNQYPDSTGFEFTKVDPLDFYESFEALGVPFISPEQEAQFGLNEEEGLGKRVSNDDIYKMITNKFIKIIDESGNLPWSAGFNDSKETSFTFAALPMNYESENYYRGINALVLSMYRYHTPETRGKVFINSKGEFEEGITEMITDNRLFWMTFKQITAAKGKVKKGSLSQQAIYYNFVHSYNGKTITEKKYNQLKNTLGEKDKVGLQRIGFLKYYNVFNERDITGIDFEAKRKALKLKSNVIKTAEKKILAADLVLKYMPKKPKFEIRHLNIKIESPHYNPNSDTVVMPLKTQFDKIESWYGIAFHEHIHATGHEKRTNRRNIKGFERDGIKYGAQYALEELVAEIGSIFLNAESGIMLSNLKNNASYIKGWATGVKKELQGNHKAIFKAAAQSQKAVEYILNFGDDGEPAYQKEFKEISKEIKEKGAEKKKKTAKKEVKSEKSTQKAAPSQPKEPKKLKTEKKADTIKPKVTRTKVEKPKVPRSKVEKTPVVEKPKVTPVKKASRTKKKIETGQLALFGLNGIALSLEEHNNHFNHQLELYKRNAHKTTFFKLGETAQILIDAGLKKTPIILQKRVLKSKIAKHGIKYSELENLPKELANPLFVFASKTHKNVFVVITKKTTKEGFLSVVLRYDSHSWSYNIQSVASLGGRNTKQISSYLYSDLLKYAHKKNVNTLITRHSIGAQSQYLRSVANIRKYFGFKDPENTGLNSVIEIEEIEVVEPVVIKEEVPGPLVVEKIEITDPVIVPTPTISKNNNSLVSNINHTEQSNGKFIIDGDIGAFLGDIEIKPVGSVACTIDAEQGAGKTRFFFQIMNELAKRYKVLFISLEEHPQSTLFQDKVAEYIVPERIKNIDTIGELEKGKEKQILDELVPLYDVVLIDSWNKIYEASKLDFDNDLRKAYNGKLIFAIFQRTVTGSMRGGAKAQFDGDIIMKGIKGANKETNTVIHNKNRYQSENLTQLSYNIYQQALIRNSEEIEEIPEVTPAKITKVEKKPFLTWDDATVTLNY